MNDTIEQNSNGCSVQINSWDYNSPEAHIFTEKCVEKLIQSPEFRRFRSYKKRVGLLYIFWFALVPLVVSLGGYIFYIRKNLDFGRSLEGWQSSGAKPFPFVMWMSLISVYILLPLSVIVCFTGHSICLSEGSALLEYLYVSSATFIFLFSVRLASESPSETSWQAIFFRISLDFATLQGFLLSGTSIFLWYSAHWSRMWLPPVPLLFLPFFVALCGIWGFCICEFFGRGLAGGSISILDSFFRKSNLGRFLLEYIRTYYAKMDEEPDVLIMYKRFLHASPSQYLEFSFYNDERILFQSFSFSLLFFMLAVMKPQFLRILELLKPMKNSPV